MSQPTTSDRRSKRILIVDDMPEQRDIAATLLRHHGYEVFEAVDGESGVDTAKRVHPDLILMDVVLPRLDGWSATRRLKADSSTADIPIVIISARAFMNDLEESAHVGAAAYVPKPCEPHEILRTVRSLIGGNA